MTCHIKWNKPLVLCEYIGLLSSDHASLSLSVTSKLMIKLCHFRGRISYQINSSIILGFLHREKCNFSGIDLCSLFLQIYFLRDG